MKFLNDFKNIFAIVGVVSIIFWTCASESTSDTTNVNPPQLTGGTYQISASAAGINQITHRIFALNTETGVIKTYSIGTSTNTWYEVGSDTPAGLDGNLVLTH